MREGAVHFMVMQSVAPLKPQPQRRSRLTSAGMGAAASILLHATLALVLLRLPSVPAMVGPDWQVPVEIMTGSGNAEGPEGEHLSTPERLLAGGHRSAQNVDTADRGHRGDALGAAQVQLLLSHADAITLHDSPLSSLEASQLQRIRTSRSRASWEDRRATPNPADDPFLASGRGERRERRPVSSVDPQSGASQAPEAGTRGNPGLLRANTSAGLRAADPGSAASSPGQGALGARGERESRAARVAHGRPHLDRGPAATEAAQAGRVQDNRDAEQLAASLLHSVVDSSRRSGPQIGDGVGGIGGGGAPGVGGGEGAGGRAHAMSPGRGAYDALDTRDARYVTWYLQQRRRVERALEFPLRRQLAMDQGLAVYHIEVRRDGSLVRPPRAVRSTGYADLDAAALSAIQRSAPFAPLPPELAPNDPSIRINMSVEFSNPMIR